MNVTVTIPNSLDDITVGQAQRLDELSKSDLDGVNLDNEILRLFLNIDNVNDISKVDRDYVLNAIQEALLDEGEFKNRFELDGINFGMIPNFDKISTSEYTDLIKYSEDIRDLHLLMAVAFRPIKNKDIFKNYNIVSYSGTSETSELMKSLPFSIAKGFEGFFLTLSNDSGRYIQRSTVEAQVRGM